MEYYTQDPPFVPESNEFIALKEERMDIITNKYTKSVAEQTFSFLKEILRKRYSNTAISSFIETSNSNIDESDKISKIIATIIEEHKWTINTTKAKFQSLKFLLKSIAVSDGFINRLSYHKGGPPKSKYDPKAIIGRKFASLPDKDAMRCRVESWIYIIKKYSKNTSPSSIRTIISFYINTCLPKINMSLNIWDVNNAVITQRVVEDICKEHKHFRWFILFCKHILEVELSFDNSFIKAEKDAPDYSSGDKHTIPASELDLLYTEAHRSSVLDELIFLIFITTGMRVGGLVKIKVAHVCTITKNDIKVLPNGRTLEKGNKWFEFAINVTVADLIKEWVVNHRKGISEYLFPSPTSSSGYMSTNTVRSRFDKLCQKADLSGEHLHLHSIRHSYAHILLKCGNDITTISKLLNHSNSQVTEQFYLKESISQVVDRANIPWLNTDNKPEDIVPKFLSNITKTKKNRGKARLEFLKNVTIV
jgi:integrase